MKYLPYPFSYNWTISRPPCLDLGCKAFKWRVWVRSCSTAPALKVSHAAINTEYSFSINQKQILAKLVDFPTPLTYKNCFNVKIHWIYSKKFVEKRTPQNAMTYGRPRFFDSKQSRSMSTLLLGDKICTSESVNVPLTVVAMRSKVPKTFPSSFVATDSHNFCAMSVATFLLIKWSCILSSTGCIVSGVRFLLPTKPEHRIHCENWTEKTLWKKNSTYL